MNLSQYKKITLPQTPGVYFFKKGNTILYIGKATNLANRTKSYFQDNLMETRGPIIVKMIEEIDAVEWKETDSVLEALILESHLIKQYQPEYNTKEKDDKSYNYVVIGNEDFPTISILRGKELLLTQSKNENKFLYTFGPFPHRDQLQVALGILRKIFPFYSQKTIKKYSKEFYRQLGLIPSPGETDQNFREEYRKNIDYLALFFEGKKKSILQKLKKEMNEAAQNLHFEKAMIRKRQIDALVHIQDIALLKRDFDSVSYFQEFRMEAYDIAHTEGKSMIGVMVVHNGRDFRSDEYRVFKIKSLQKANDTAALAEVLERRLEHKEWQFPTIIIVDGGIAQKRRAEKVLRERNIKIPVIAVVKDEKHKAKALLGQKGFIKKYEKSIIAINNESHRFAISQHIKKRSKELLQK